MMKVSHNYDEGVITKEATKTETGIKTYTCKDCKTTKTEVIPKRNDDFNVDSQSPVIDKNSIKLNANTFTEGDTLKVYAKITDNVGIASAVVILKNNDTNKSIQIRKPIYHENNGLYEFSMKIDDQIPNGHWYLEGVQAYDAADNLGIFVFDSHEYSFIVKDSKVDSESPVIDLTSIKLNANTFTEGDTLKVYAKITDNVGIASTVVILKNNDTNKSIQIRKPIYHENNGLYEFSMKIDDEIPNGHWYLEGVQAYDSIDNLGIIVFDQYEKPFIVTRNNMDVHNWDDGVITTKATCTTDGVKTYTCKDCKTTKTEVIKALGHDYSKDWTIDKKATCTESGSKSHHCTRCDEKTGVTVIPKLSHNWILTSTVNPTRDHEGKKVYTCNLCKETKEESIPKLVGKWVSNSVGKWYEYSDGTYENSGFKKIENETYYFTSNGYVKTGWLSVNNNWYFFKNSGCMVTSNWAGSYYMGSEGKMKTNAFTPDGYYCGADGVYVRNAWVNHNGNYYYMDANGLMTKNAWVGDYYLGADGVMKTNTFTPDGYYVGSDGAYYRNRWIKYENKYYYTNSAGLIVKNAWIGAYYLGSDGVMIVNSFTPDGYYVGADGAYLRNQKIEVDGKEYYLNAVGKVAKNQWVGDYFIDMNGNVVKNHWAGNYWCGADGRYVKSSWVDDGRYYVGPNGVYVTNQWIGDYYLNGAGLVTKNAWVGNYWCGSDGKYVKSSWVDNNQYYVGANGVYVPGRWVAYGSRWCYYAGSVYAKDITLNINGIAYTFDCNGYMK
ncbi:hypothetical protein [Holdemanella biformis]|uniref:N-acetylmuramoyl-L-alanine amidase family protein n=1 Tax=Holdemanella biformis TaxID=1735 RepID=A0A412IX55_9FIRM|nr:hypothetical protein [Holdemanella biformis]RGS44633.1 hypothetical protein DWX92_10390 [Holdemanella biformis]